MRKASKRVLSGFAFMIAGVGCSVIVGNDVPDFSCSVNADGVCPAGMVCDLSVHKCVATDGSTTVDVPADDDASDSTMGRTETSVEADAPMGPYDLGLACRVDIDCKSKLCGTSTTLTTAITSRVGPICTTPCCSSADCPATLVCFNGGTGGSYCVPSSLAGRSDGTGAAGSSCTAATDCRSGLCGIPDGESGPKTCLDTCCADGECSGTSICRLATVSAPSPAHSTWQCAPMLSGTFRAPGYSGADCDTTCTTNACTSGTNCRPPCSNSASCQAITGFESGVCVHGTVNVDNIHLCIKSTVGAGPVGSACTASTSCVTDYCDQETQTCLNVCAKDSDCAPTEACRPSASGTPYLRCVGKP